MDNMERRSGDLEIRADLDGDTPTIEGYAAVFNSETELWRDSFEQIAPGAFENVLKSRSNDTVALYNHDSNLILGRRSAKTLELSEDKKGLRYKISLPNTSTGNDLKESVKRGDVKGSSFGFTVKAEEWREDKGKMHRTITEIGQLFDVGPVTFPAYSDTTVAARSLDKFRGEADMKAGYIAEAVKGEAEEAAEIEAESRKRQLALRG